MIQLSVLGGVALRRDGQPVTGRPAQRHHIALLAYLAAAPGCRASRDKLIGVLWPELDSARARHRLSVAIHVLRSGLGEECLGTAGDGVGLNPDLVATDLGDFLEAVEAGRLEAAVGLYAGPFMDGFFLSDAVGYDEWMDQERNRLSGLYRSALERLIAEADQTGNRRAAADWWRRLAAHDRYSASTAMGLMRALAGMGDVGAAVRHARTYATLVEGELEVPANPEVLKLAEELVKEVPAAALEVEPIPVPPSPSPVPRASTHPSPAGTDLRLARRVAGWVAIAVLLTLVLATILSLGANPSGGTAQQQGAGSIGVMGR
jgi:DNA-binding SARP family transcriptional activator